MHVPLHSSAHMPRPSRLHPEPLRADGEALGARLARLRKDKGFTQVELAKKMGIIQVLVSDYENDKLRPHPDMLVRFALALGVSTDEILGLRATPKRETPAINRRFLRRLQQIDTLPKRDQDALLRMIDAILRGRAA